VYQHEGNFLAQQRLAVVSPLSGDQPLFNEDRTVVVVVRNTSRRGLSARADTRHDLPHDTYATIHDECFSRWFDFRPMGRSTTTRRSGSSSPASTPSPPAVTARSSSLW